MYCNNNDCRQNYELVEPPKLQVKANDRAFVIRRDLSSPHIPHSELGYSVLYGRVKNGREYLYADKWFRKASTLEPRGGHRPHRNAVVYVKLVDDIEFLSGLRRDYPLTDPQRCGDLPFLQAYFHEGFVYVRGSNDPVDMTPTSLVYPCSGLHSSST